MLNYNFFRLVYMEKVAIALQEWAKDKNYKQRELANILGVAQPYIGRMMKGKQEFGKNTARKWADAFGMSYTFLLTGEGSLFDQSPDVAEQATEDVAAGLDPESAEYWRKKYEECLAELYKERAISEGLRIALGAVRDAK